MKNLQEKFQTEVRPKLQKEFNLKSPLAVPKVSKVVVSMGIKEGAKDQGVIEKVKTQLMEITGQAPRVCRAKKSIASFNLGKGSPIGLAVTLRKKRMYDFLERLFWLVLPRMRDFHGVSLAGFDGRGNYNLGIPEIIVFPEIDYAKIDKIRGLQVTIVTNTKDNKKAKRLLEELGMPFARQSAGQDKT